MIRLPFGRSGVRTLERSGMRTFGRSGCCEIGCVGVLTGCCCGAAACSCGFDVLSPRPSNVSYLPIVTSRDSAGQLLSQCLWLLPVFALMQPAPEGPHHKLSQHHEVNPWT